MRRLIAVPIVAFTVACQAVTGDFSVGDGAKDSGGIIDGGGVGDAAGADATTVDAKGDSTVLDGTGGQDGSSVDATAQDAQGDGAADPDAQLADAAPLDAFSDAGTDSSACNATSCPNGCCTSTGTCQPYSGQSSTSCGTAGAMCAGCGGGQACASGVCSCGGGACAGCCNGSTCEALSSESNTSCGSGGAACKGCPTGQECNTTTGQCVCDAASCPGGCCNGGPTGTCEVFASESNTSCGVPGATCAGCGAGLECNKSTGACVCDATSCPGGCCNGSTCVVLASESNTTCGSGGAACANCTTSGETCASGTCVSEPPTNGLVGFWTFDTAGSTAPDSSGNHNDGTVTGATQIPGKIGLGYQFGGAGCVTIPDSPSLAMNGGSTLTMMAWVSVMPCPQPDSGYINRGTVLGKTGEYEHSVTCGSSPNYQEAVATAQDKNWADQPGVPISAATWHHVATTWDAQTVYQYIDGVEVQSRALPGGNLSSTAVYGVASGVGIGCGNVVASGATGSDAYWFVGAIDEVALYNRALSATEIQDYYAATK